MSPCFAGAKRPLEMVLYNPTTAAAANKRARQEDAATTSSSSAGAASATTTSEPLVVLDVKPLNAIRPPRLSRPSRLPLAAAAAREAPPCLRRHFLAWLGLRGDVSVHFIDEKILTDTDLNPHQNRFRIPREGVIHRLLPLLTPAEIDLANLIEEHPPRPRPPRSKPNKEPLDAAVAAAKGNGLSSGKKVKKPKAKGKVHGGLRVKLVDLIAGAKELLMSRWHSSRGTVVKGEGYLDFIRRCSFKEKDAVEIWAFVQRRVRLFGKDLCDDSLLHVLVVKKDQLPQQCRCCPAAPAVNPPTNLVMA